MKRTRLMSLGAVVLLVLLGSVAVVGGRYLSVSRATAGSIFGNPSIGAVWATELPASGPDAVGIVVKREDNTFSIGTNVVKFHTVRDASGKITNREVGYDGPIIAVVVTHDTAIYRDVTLFGPGQVASSGPVQQVVRTGSLDEIGQQTLLQVWGERQGDRIVARVILIMALPN
jgi:hypothetical protein